MLTSFRREFAIGNIHDAVDKKEAWCGKIIDLHEGKEQVAVGTIYKEMNQKPNILEEFASDKTIGIAMPKVQDNYCSDDDEVFLEDHSGRVQLKADHQIADILLTGVVAGVRGLVTSAGEMIVTGICFGGLPSSASPQKALKPSAPQGPYVLLVSGLNCGAQVNPLPFELLAQYVRGMLGTGQEMETVAAIQRVIVAGGLVNEQAGTKTNAAFGNRSLTSQQQDVLASPMREVDMLLSLLAGAVPVDVMPGQFDPTNRALPQQRLHPCLFRNSGRYSSFRSVTNPYEFSLGELRFLGTSGQNVDNAVRYVRHIQAFPGYVPNDLIKAKDIPKHDLHKFAKDPLNRILTMVNMLFWRHIAPTAPDTLACYPFKESEPFVLRDTPSVFFAGNQPDYASALLNENGLSFDEHTNSTSVHGVKDVENSFANALKQSKEEVGSVRLIAVPDFSKTGIAVLLNTETLETTPLAFDTGETANETPNENIVLESTKEDIQVPEIKLKKVPTDTEELKKQNRISTENSLTSPQNDDQEMDNSDVL